MMTGERSASLPARLAVVAALACAGAATASIAAQDKPPPPPSVARGPAAKAPDAAGPRPPGQCFKVYKGAGVGSPRPPGGGRVTTAHGFSVFGKLKYPAGFKRFDYVNPHAPQGGSFRTSMPGTFDSLNNYVVLGSAPLGLAMGSPDRETLMARSLDEDAAQYGHLAETISYPEDYSWVQYRLNPRARWHDGVPITADDVVFTVDFLMTKGNPVLRTFFPCLQRIEKIDRLTVRFVFADRYNLTQTLNTGDTAVLPRHYAQKVDISKPSLTPILGSGPMRIVKVDPGRSVVFEQVPDYWAKDLPVNVGRWNFGQYRIDFYRDQAAAFEAFMGGALDYRSLETAARWAVGYDRPAVRKGWIKKRSMDSPVAGFWGLVINNRREKFSNPKLREALGYALDFGFVNRALQYGQYARVRSYFPKSRYEAKGPPSRRELELLEPFRDQLDPRVFTAEFNPPQLDGTWASRRANLLKARRLLLQAGYVVRGGRLVRASTGEPLTIEIVLQDPSALNMLGAYARNLKTLGIRSEIKLVDSAQYARRMEQKAFDMTVGLPGLPTQPAPGSELRAPYGSAGAGGRGGYNYAGIVHPAVDVLLDKLIGDPDMAEKEAAGRALDRVLSWGFYQVPLYRLARVNTAYWDKFGQPPSEPLNRLGGVEVNLWWVDPAKEAVLARARGRG